VLFIMKVVLILLLNYFLDEIRGTIIYYLFTTDTNETSRAERGEGYIRMKGVTVGRP
jgi:hypothetical protein